MLLFVDNVCLNKLLLQQCFLVLTANIFIYLCYSDFKYQNDSVLEVTLTNYKNCSVSNPISMFKDGNTTFQFGRSGNFYFISGQPSHCNAGQKMAVIVMAEEETRSGSPNSAPSPNENGNKGNGSDSDDDDGWDTINWGPPSLNSTIKMSMASCFMTAFAAVLAILYLLV